MEQRQLLAEIDRIRGITRQRSLEHDVRLPNVIHTQPSQAGISESELANLFHEIDKAGTIAKTGT
jgi:hypothetical protein